MKKWFLIFLLILPVCTIFSEDIHTNQSCFSCHANENLKGFKAGKEISMFIHKQGFNYSAHANLACIDCHKDIQSLPHSEDLQPVNCAATCHQPQKAQLAASSHQSLNCSDCHTKPHLMVPVANENSEVHKNNIVILCSKCHAENATTKTVSPRMKRPVEHYMTTVHGKAYLSGKKIAAACVDCHGAHNILPGYDPRSTVNRYNIFTRCQKCHKDQVKIYLSSIHGQAVLNKVPDAPVCTTCHGEHTIISRKDPASPVNKANISEMCSHCHAARQISSQFGFSIDRVASYNHSVHGLKMQAGVTTAANCASCHSNHNILPASNPLSTVNPANLEKTCGKCHEGNAKYFASIKVHDEMNPPPVGPAGFIQTLYRWGLPIILGLMLLHNLLIFSFYIRRKFKTAKISGSLEYSIGDFIYHSLMILIITILIITGFANRYPSSGLADLVMSLGLTEAGSSLIHHLSGVLLILMLGYHGLRTIFSGTRRQRLLAHIPHPRDGKDLIQSIKYYSGMQTSEPESRSIGYAKKIQFWILVWGFAFMSVTGLFLWISFSFLRSAPLWMIELARVIHHYEAWLMVLGIIIWHFFHTIFHPKQYPLKISIDSSKQTSQKKAKQK